MVLFFCFLVYSANTVVADSPFVIPQDEADQVLASANNGGVAEPIPDTSICFYYNRNLYSKLWLIYRLE